MNCQDKESAWNMGTLLSEIETSRRSETLGSLEKLLHNLTPLFVWVFLNPETARLTNLVEWKETTASGVAVPS